jgi:Ca2+-binding RTX toxin-like protein
VVGQTGGTTTVSELDGGTTDTYTVRLSAEAAARVAAGAVVYVTVSATRSSTADRALLVPSLAAGTGITFAAGGTTITAPGQLAARGLRSLPVAGPLGTGDADGTYEIVSVTANTITVRQAFAAGAANLATASVTGQRAESVLVSADGTTFSDAIVLRFDATNAFQAITVTVKAQDDAAAEGLRDVVISHSVASTDATLDRARVENLDVAVQDDDLAGVRLIPSGTDTLVLEGTQGITDSWGVVLTRAPNAGEVVTVTLATPAGSDLSFSRTVFHFTAANWSTVQTVTVTATADGAIENRETHVVTHSVTTTGGRYAAVASQAIDVTVVDGDSAGVLVRETDGDTLVELGGAGDSYTLRLTKAPTAPVTLTVFDDGQTRILAGDRVSLVTLVAPRSIDVQFQSVANEADRIVRSSGSWTADGFAAGQTLRVAGSDSNDRALLIAGISADGLTLFLADASRVTTKAGTASFSVTAAQVTFTAENWAQEVTVKVAADPGFVPSATDLVTMAFPTQAHTVARIEGPLLIDGGVLADRDRSLRTAVMLPTERDPGPIPLTIVVNEAAQDDRVTIFNDSDPTGTAGRMGLASQSQSALLVDGLGMGTGTVTFAGDEDSGPLTFDRGITMRTVEIVEVLLGHGNDAFRVEAANPGSDRVGQPAVTAIHGGGGSDTITLVGTARANSLIVIHGDTDTLGARYDWLGGAPSGGGLVFAGSGNDTVDARLWTGAVGTSGLVIHGGAGDDTIWGSQLGDHIAGGSGNDLIRGEGGDDHIYGDAGFSVDLAARLLSVNNTPSAPLTRSGDTRAAGSDTIDGGSGDDVILSDYGTIGQAAGTMRLATTGAVTRIETLTFDQGAADTIQGGLGDDVILAGFGGDAIADIGGANIILGDHGVVDWLAGTDTNRATLDRIASLATAIGGNDTITTTGTAVDVVIGGTGEDLITLGGALSLVFGDNGEIEAAATGAAIVALALTVGTMRSVAPTNGARDEIMGGSGADIVIGGGGGDFIATGQGSAVVLGDEGMVTLGTGAASLGNLPLALVRVETTDAALGGADTIVTGLGEDLVLGGVGGDSIMTGLGTGTDGADIVLGDNGFVTWSSVTGRATQIRSTDPLQGGDDRIETREGNDLILGGTGSDEILAGMGNDLVLGDHGDVFGDIDETKLPLVAGLPFDYRALWTTAADGGAADLILGGDGDDTILGQQGADVIFGGAGDDDLIGGHNVNLDQNGGIASDGGDWIDGGLGDDHVLGDNGQLYRTGTLLDPRMRALSGTLLYGIGGTADGKALVTAASRTNVDGTAQRSVVIFDHFEGANAAEFGNDVIAGGADDDSIWGQMGDDTIQGDGSIDFDGNLAVDPTLPGASRDALRNLVLTPSRDDFAGAGTDGDDYIEGNGGADTIFGNLGQDDIIGGSSSLYGLTTAAQRPDGADIIFGGSGTRSDRNDEGQSGLGWHARDADVIAGDNADILRIVGINGTAGSGYVSYQWDTYGGEKVIVRAVSFLDYTEGGPDRVPGSLDRGAGDEIHGEGGDDQVYGMTGNDVMFGDGQNDDLIGGWGNDWISGGTGVDGILGDDGRIMTSRNSTAYGETLFGITPLPQVNQLVTGPTNTNFRYIINVAGQLKKTVNITPYNVTPTGQEDLNYVPLHANDIIFGGWDDDFLHGGSGNDAISGAEALLSVNGSWTFDGLHQISWDRPFNPGNALLVDPATGRVAHYNPLDPRERIAVNGGWFFLDFNANEGRIDPRSATGKRTDGDDVIFGGIGHDAAMGGTGRDRLTAATATTGSTPTTTCPRCSAPTTAPTRTRATRTTSWAARAATC